MKTFKQFVAEVKKPTGKLKDACWTGYTAVGMKMKGGRKVPNCVPEEVVSESMPSGVIKIKQRYADMSAKEFAQNHGHKKDDELRAMAWRHGYGKNSNYYVDKKREGQGASKQVQEGIGNVEDSPQSATNSVKAMESAHRDRQMKSARMIKSLYKNKIKETTYDWEKDDKPNAKIVVKGGTTMTGQPRDTVEIEPVLKTRPNQQKPTV